MVYQILLIAQISSFYILVMINIFSINYWYFCSYFLGNEEKGMKFKISSLCDDHVCVNPAHNLHPLVDSLNVSVATGIILHHLTKKNKL